MSIVKRRKRTVRQRQKKNATMEEEESVGGTDPIFTPAEQGVRKTLAWIIKTQAQAGGVSDWYGKLIEKPATDHEMTQNVPKEKVRSEDTPCVEKTRVKLKELTDPTKDFIHANLVNSPPSNRAYIVTQHPLDATFEDFWRMVFYENCDTIIALYSQDENLPLYYPNGVGKFATHGAFFINCRKVTPAASKYAATTYLIEVLPDGCSNSRMVNLLHYSYWPKGKVPTDPRVIMKLLRCITVDVSTKGPAVVHCASGTNRAGCFVMTDILVDLMFRNVEVDIPALVQSFRSQRAQFLNNKILFSYALYTVADYVRIRLKRYRSAPDLLKEIETFQVSVAKDWASIIAREPQLIASKSSTSAMVQPSKEE